MKSELTKQEIEYHEKYGTLPDTRPELLAMIMESFELPKDKFDEEAKRIQEIAWQNVKFVIDLVPTPTPRPRYSSSTKTFYVKGSKNNKKIIRRILDQYPIIYTSTKFTVTTYQPTPMSSMSKMEVALAEAGIIRPTVMPDWDNFGKTYSDMLQGYLLINDNIITSGIVEKYYSIRPRVEIDIWFQSEFDSKYSKRVMTNSKAYQELANISNRK